jgi:hypothetical protein
MTVLFITNNNSTTIAESLSWFKFFCNDPSDILLFNNISKAKGFIENSLIEEKEQKHIDFIISDWQFGRNNVKTLLDWIRKSEDEYSSKNFQIKSLPFLLINDSKNTVIEEGFDGIIDGFPNEIWRFEAQVKLAIKKWRYSIADDLDLIGLNPKTQNNYDNHQTKFIAYYRLKVLTKKFVDNKVKKLNYIWTSPKIGELNSANDEFYDMIRRTIDNPKAYSEKRYHEFFKENPTLIKGEHFLSKKVKEELIYEPHLYKNGTAKYDEPDFLNKPHEYSLRFPEVFEIKLQTQRLLRNTNDKFLYKAKKSFDQVARYKKYLTSDDPRNHYYIKKYLGKIYANYNFTLLMGSEAEKEANMDLIERLKSDFDFSDIKLVTYEELLTAHIELCNRLQDLNIF